MLLRIDFVLVFSFTVRSWSYVSHAYDTQSRKVAEILWQNRRFKPIENEEGKSQDALLNCAIRHRFLRYNPTGGKTITARSKWISAAQKEKLDKAKPHPCFKDDEIINILKTGAPHERQAVECISTRSMK